MNERIEITINRNVAGFEIVRFFEGSVEVKEYGNGRELRTVYMETAEFGDYVYFCPAMLMSEAKIISDTIEYSKAVGSYLSGYAAAM